MGLSSSKPTAEEIAAARAAMAALVDAMAISDARCDHAAWLADRTAARVAATKAEQTEQNS